MADECPEAVLRRARRKGGASGAPEPRVEPGAQWLEQLAERARDPEFAGRLSPDDLLLLLHGQCLYFGRTRLPEVAEGLGYLFARATEAMPASERLEALDRVAEAVRSGTTTVLALLPFLQHERSVEVTEAASLLFATLMPVTDDDTLAGPRVVLAMIEHADRAERRVGLLSGLVQLGDGRLRTLLAGAWRRLSADERDLWLNRHASLASVLHAEFLLDWLADPEAGSARVATALARLPGEGHGRLLSLERKFPVNASDERPEITVLGEWSAPDWARRESARFHALARLPHAAGLLGDVLAAWGLAPSS